MWSTATVTRTNISVERIRRSRVIHLQIADHLQGSYLILLAIMNLGDYDDDRFYVADLRRECIRWEFVSFTGTFKH